MRLSKKARRALIVAAVAAAGGLLQVAATYDPSRPFDAAEVVRQVARALLPLVGAAG